jgi:hypothetical protein
MHVFYHQLPTLRHHSILYVGLSSTFYFHNVIGSRVIGELEHDSRGFTPSCYSLHYLLRPRL